MIKYFLLLLALISPNLSAYQSLKNYYGFDKIKGKDDVCSFKYSSVTYVKPCENGKYCEDFGEDLSLCVDAKKIISKKSIGQSCSSSSECISGLYCDNTCKSHCGDSNLQDYLNKYGMYYCKDTHIQDGLYYYREFDNDNNPKSSTLIYNDIDIFKVGGKIYFHSQKQSDNSYHYYEEKKELAYIGSVKDNEFVEDPIACSSGFAIKFYPDGTLKDPSNSYPNQKFYKCVTVKDVGYYNGNCYIKYGDNDEIYFGSDISGTCNELLLTKLNLFKKYIGVYTPEKQKSCDKSENYNEVYTCNDDEIRKWYYFYNSPLDYLLYYNEKDDKGTDITTYLIKQIFNSYQSAGILNIKYIILLLFLLSL